MTSYIVNPKAKNRASWSTWSSDPSIWMSHERSSSEVLEFGESFAEKFFEDMFNRIGGILEPEEDGYYVASIPGLKGCVSQGKGKIAAIGNFLEAMTLLEESKRVIIRESKKKKVL